MARRIRLRESLYQSQRGFCYLCGERMTREQATLEHLLPKSKGGKEHRKNLLLAHKECNLIKADFAITRKEAQRLHQLNYEEHIKQLMGIPSESVEVRKMRMIDKIVQMREFGATVRQNSPSTIENKVHENNK